MRAGRRCAFRHLPAATAANHNDAAPMRPLDERFTAWPVLRARRMAPMLRTQGPRINRKRVQRLMRKMGSRRSGHDLAQRGLPPATSFLSVSAAQPHKERVDHVWAADITYILVGQGFLNLVAIIGRAGAMLAWRWSE